MKTKYVFVTGGVVSGLGKGITAASLGRLLKNRGYKVANQKMDPYINVDPGTMNPCEHGEVFALLFGKTCPIGLKTDGTRKERAHQNVHLRRGKSERERKHVEP